MKLSAKRNRIAFLTPAADAFPETADVSAELVSRLRQRSDVQLFERIPRSFRPTDFDQVLYHLGNDPGYSDIYEMALQHPGIVVLREVNLYEVIRARTEGDNAAWLREVYYEIFGQEWKNQHDPSLGMTGLPPRTFSALRRVVDRSLAFIVHGRYAESTLRMKGFRGRIAQVPPFVPRESPDGGLVRKRLGFTISQPVIGIFGPIRPENQLADCLRVVRQLQDHFPGIGVLISARTEDDAPLRRLAAQTGLARSLSIEEARSTGEIDEHIAACSLVLNLRSPEFGETWPLTARAMGLGIPVVVSDSGPNQELPNDAGIRIPCDRHRWRVLFESLQWLLSAPGALAEIGASAAKWASTQWDRTDAAYADFVDICSHPTGAAESSASTTDPALIENCLGQWLTPGTEGAEYMEGHKNRLVRTLQLTPPGRPGDSVLEMGCYLQITPALRNIRGYGEVRGCYLGSLGRDVRVVESQDGDFFQCVVDLFDCERDRFPYPDSCFATVLCCELLEHLKSDPMRMMMEIHRVIRPGGTLVLTTPNVVSLRCLSACLNGYQPGFYNRFPNPEGELATQSKHEREYTPFEVSQLLDSAGFTVEHIETQSYGKEPFADTKRIVDLLKSANQPTALRGDCIIAIGRKESAPGNPRPDWLYDS